MELGKLVAIAPSPVLRRLNCGRLDTLGPPEWNWPIRAPYYTSGQVAKKGDNSLHEVGRCVHGKHIEERLQVN